MQIVVSLYLSFKSLQFFFSFRVFKIGRSAGIPADLSLSTALSSVFDQSKSSSCLCSLYFQCPNGFTGGDSEDDSSEEETSENADLFFFYFFFRAPVTALSSSTFSTSMSSGAPDAPCVAPPTGVVVDAASRAGVAPPVESRPVCPSLLASPN